MLQNIWRFRGFIFRGAAAELRTRYSGSALGFLWIFLVPIAHTMIYAAVFTNLMIHRMGQEAGGSLFVLYLCSGLLPWFAFVDALIRGSSAFRDHAVYLRKLALPEEIFVAKVVLADFFRLSIYLAALVGLVVVCRVPMSTDMALGPVIGVLLMAFAFGLGLLLAPLCLFFRDIQETLHVALTIWLWSVPVVYLENILPDALQRVVVWNPLYPYINALHEVFVFGRPPGLHDWAGMLLWSLASIALGRYVLSRLRKNLRDML